MTGQFGLRRCSSTDGEDVAIPGQFDGLRPCSSKDASDGEEGSQMMMMKVCSAKRRKAAVAAEEAGETKKKADQGEVCCFNGEEEAADAVSSCFKVDGEEEDAVVAGGETLGAVKKKGMRLPDDEVKWILARKKEYLTPDNSTAEEIAAHRYLSDIFTEYQEWVQQQYDANNGNIYLDDEQVERRAKNAQMVQDMIDQIKVVSLADLDVETSDRYSDFYESDEEEEEEVVQELNAN